MTDTHLLVKMSSMGDLVHTFPALTEAASHGHRFDWVVEEAFASLAAQHPAIRDVHAIALRRWRRTPLRSWGSLRRFMRGLRQMRYPMTLDAQGLLKSAIVSRWAGSPRRIGFAAGSAREPIASRAYTEAHAISPEQHAIARLRSLFGAALGYTPNLAVPVAVQLVERAAPLAPPGERPRVLLLHGTTWPSKEYPLAAWRELVLGLTDRGWQADLLAGSAAEHARAQTIAADVAKASAVPPGSLLGAVDQLLAADLVVGVDSGLTHLAAVLGKPTLALYGPTDAKRTGAHGKNVRNLASEFRCAPCLRRECNYRGTPIERAGQVVEPPCFAEVEPNMILAAAEDMLGEPRGLHL